MSFLHRWLYGFIHEGPNYILDIFPIVECRDAAGQGKCWTRWMISGGGMLDSDSDTDARIGMLCFYLRKAQRQIVRARRVDGV